MVTLRRALCSTLHSTHTGYGKPGKTASIPSLPLLAGLLVEGLAARLIFQQVFEDRTRVERLVKESSPGRS